MSAPRKFDRDELVPKICERLGKGEPLTVICRDLGLGYRCVNRWREEDEEIAAQFDEARDIGYDAIAMRARKTMRGKGIDEGGETTGDVSRDKAIVELDMKLLAKWDRRRYGDKQEIELSGGIDLKKIERVIVDPANPDTTSIRSAS